MNNDYISRQALFDAYEQEQMRIGAWSFEKLLKSIPAADVAPIVHETPMLRYRPERYERYDEYGINENGEMLYVKRVLVDEKSYAMYCPACGKRICSRFKSFCPNCGAKMDG